MKASRPLRFIVLSMTVACFAVTALAQPSDTWSNVPPASDDRLSNPKGKLYAGPNGW